MKLLVFQFKIISSNIYVFTIIDIEVGSLFDLMIYDIRSDHKISKQYGSYN